MGHTAIMKLALLFAALAITAHCVPISLSPEEMGAVSTDIKNAKDNLDQMVATEATEIKQIREVKTAIEGVKDDKSLTEEAVLKAAEKAQNDEQQAASDEQQQQNMAMQALKQVNNAKPVLQKFEKAGGPLQKANEKIDQVADTLTRGTKTMNNQHLVNQMAQQSTELINKLNKPMLGETQSPEPHQPPGGALTNLNAAQQPEPKAEGGVLSLLKAAPQQKDPLAQAEDNLKALQAQIPEEHSVVEAEKRAENEIKGLINDLK